MTREKDEFLRLDDRVRIAREHEADLFISIHADTIRLKGIRGATVYTVSEKASDAEAQALADRENLSDQLAGIEIEEENHEVADILIDLIRRETHSFSMRFARSLVGELSTTVGLINNPHRFAGFKVLKAPDVPSVLLELGYLSNAKDEEQLQERRMARQGGGEHLQGDRDFARPPEARAADMAARSGNRRTVSGVSTHSGHNYSRDCSLPRDGSAVFCPHRRTKAWRIRNGSVPATRGCRRVLHWNPRSGIGAGMIRLIGYFFGIGTALALLVAAGIGVVRRQSGQGPARLRSAGEVRAAGNDPRACVGRRADGRVCPRAPPLSADPGGAGPRQGGIPVGRGQEFLQPPRHRRDRPLPRGHQRTIQTGAPASRRLDHHAAGGEELPARPRTRPSSARSRK